MSDVHSTTPDGGPCEVPIAEQCEATLAHYERLATAACAWHSAVPQAIRAWYAAKTAASETHAAQLVSTAGCNTDEAGGGKAACVDDKTRSDTLPLGDLREYARRLERELALSEKSGESVAEDASEAIVALHQSATRPTATDIAGAVARGWCSPLNRAKEMDSDLAFAITTQILSLLAATDSGVKE